MARRDPDWWCHQRVCPFCRRVQHEVRYRCVACGTELTALDRLRAWRRLRRDPAQLGLSEETRAAGLLLAGASLPLAATYVAVQFGLTFLRAGSRVSSPAALLSEATSLLVLAAVAASLGAAMWALRRRSRS